MITIKEFIKNAVDYLESKKISDIKFITNTLIPHDGKIQLKEKHKPNRNLHLIKCCNPISPNIPQISSAVYQCNDTFEFKIDIFLDFIDGLEDTIQILLMESSNGEVEVAAVMINYQEIPLEFIRTNETDPSIISLTTTRELGKETKAEPFTL